MDREQNFFEGKRVVVTGAGGLLGTHLVPSLLEQGAWVRAVIRNRDLPFRDERLEVVPADLTQQPDCDRIMADMDIACLCASVTVGASQAIHNPTLAVTSNLVMAARSLQAAQVAGVRHLLITSSTTVYPAYDRPVREDEAFLEEPHPAYQGVANMKRYVEKLAKFYHDRFGIHVAITRPVPFYGRYDNFDLETCHVIPALIRKAVEKWKPYEVWGTGNDIRDFLHVRDVARGCLLALEHTKGYEDFNLGCGKGTSVKELAEAIVRLADCDTAIVFNASKPSTIPIRLVDVSKAEEKLGFKASVSLEEGLADTIQWFATNRQEILKRLPKHL